VNNVETLCAAARIMEKGADWFSAIGTKDSTGTKLISVSGDCKEPGVYEIDYGTSVADFLKMCGAKKTKAVQIGGPSGRLIGPKDFDGAISFEKFPTGGSLIVFDESRDVLQYMRQFMEFFTEESCGWCAPCRTGTSLLLVEFEKILDGRGTQADLDNLKKLGELVKTMSRCGLGQTAANPILTSMESFPELYKAIIKPDEYIGRFEFDKAVKAGEEMAGRKSELEEAHS
jgi:[NiFe] hydrogenase diaphorase moiety large subunit